MRCLFPIVVLLSLGVSAAVLGLSEVDKEFYKKELKSTWVNTPWR